MQTVQSTNILTIGTSLTTEALRIGTILDRQLCLVQYHVAIDIGYRNLSSGDEVEIVNLAMIHLSFLVRQLTRAVAGSCIHHRRRHNLGIATLTGLVEEEVDERTLQAGTLSDIDGESSSRNLNTQIEVYQIIFLGQFPVGQGILDTQLGVDVPVAHRIMSVTLLQVRLHHVVVGSLFALRHFVIGNVGNLAKQTSHLILSVVHRLLQLLVSLLHVGHTLLDGIGLCLLALLHQLSNLCSQLLGLSQVLVQLLLGLTTLPVNSQHLVDGFLGILEMFLFQTANHAVCLLCNEFQCKHNINLQFDNLLF